MWEESKHPRDDDGRFTSKNGTPAEHKRLREKGIISREEEKELNNKVKSKSIKAETGYTITATKAEMKKLEEMQYQLQKKEMKELVNQVLNFEPIKLKIGDREITAKFDKYGARKNIYTRGTSDIDGQRFKIENIKELPNYIKTSTYSWSQKEKGKELPQHKGVKEWHYFINQIKTNKGVFDLTINVRDLGESQYFYEISFRKQKNPKQ